MPPAPRPAPRAREGTRGTTLSPARPAHTPNASSSAKPLPGLTSPYGQSLVHRPRPPHTQGETSPDHLTHRGIVLVLVPACRHGRPAAPEQLICAAARAADTSIGSCTAWWFRAAAGTATWRQRASRP